MTVHAWHTIKDNQHRQLKRLIENTAWKVTTFQINCIMLKTDTWPLAVQTRLHTINIQLQVLKLPWQQNLVQSSEIYHIMSPQTETQPVPDLLVQLNQLDGG
jgi:hypothetical protein